MRQSVRRLSTILAATALTAAGLLSTGNAARAATGPSSVDFGTVPVGVSETISFVVTAAPGYDFVGAGGIDALNPPWAFAFVDCPQVDGVACTMTETFTPSVAGPATAVLHLFECPVAGGSCNDFPVTLTGVGGAAVTNGTMTASPGSAAPGSAFSAASTTPCPAGTQGVTVKLLDSGGNPIATHAGFLNGGGSWAGTVTVPSNTAAGPAFVTAVCDNGHGTALGEYNFVPVTISAPAPPPSPAAFSVNPSALSFGTVHMGHSLTEFVVVTNTGGLPLSFTAVAITAGGQDFKVSSNTCSGSLAGGASCHTGVTFKPTVANNRAGILRYTDTVGTQTVGLSGRGCLLICGS